MLKPHALKPGSTIGVCAPASPVRKEFLERGLEELRRRGFQTRLGRGLYSKTGYTAGDAQTRLSDLVELWEDSGVDGIICARGGYGSLDLLQRLDAEIFRKNPKVFVGSSDVTALLCFLIAKAGMVCFHGPMVAQQIARGNDAYHSASLVGMLQRSESWEGLSSVGLRVLHEGSAEGMLVGGCLSLIAALVGTPFLPSFDGSILFLEDTNVRPYQIDRMLRQLRLAGCLDGVRGLVFGEMPNCQQHPDQGYRTDELLGRLTAEWGVPVMFGLPSGHTVTPAWTIPFGVQAKIEASGLRLLEGAVA
jgi:muramoyltetrapeptide carboxypeptidase